MRTVIGIDVGGSTTKIVGFREKADRRELLDPMFVRSYRPDYLNLWGVRQVYLAERSRAVRY